MPTHDCAHTLMRTGLVALLAAVALLMLAAILLLLPAGSPIGDGLAPRPAPAPAPRRPR